VDIATHPFNNSLVILIHGVMSNRYLAWKTIIDLIQEIHDKGSAPLKSYDYASFGYESGWFHQPSIERAFEDLQKLIDRARYDSVVLVGHSQGGVLAKLFILDQLLEKQRGEKLKVDLVITLDSPHRGPQPWIYPVAVIGGVWKRIPLLRRFPLFRQVAELGIGSKNLRRLKKFWKADVVAQQPCKAEPKRRYIKSYTLSGTKPPFPPVKLIVSEKSAFGFKIDERINDPEVQRKAWGVGHGVEAMTAYREQIEEKLIKNAYAGIKAIVDTPSGPCSAAISACLGPASANELPWWEQRFATGFHIRPLRQLDFPAAVKKFIDLRKQHP
jgi:pimeloyl-ACP methyl ester carboxylesterase